MAPKNPVVAHRHLTLVFCDSAASLAEVLTQIDLTELPHKRFGDRAIALPSPHAAMIRQTLRDGGTYPRVIGDPFLDDDTEDVDDTEEEEDDE